MERVSVLIPARNEPYLAKTIDDIFAKSAGDIEVLVMLDGWKPEPGLKERPNLRILYREEPKGMRNAVNCLAAAAGGRYLMKVDAHCLFADGFDEILQVNMEPNWLITPTRYRLNVEKWERFGNALEYLYLTFPYSKDHLYGSGFHGKKWIGVDGLGKNMGKSEYYWMENARRQVEIDDIMTIQGSCWFVSKQHFVDIGGQDEVHSYFYQEPQEMTFKTWLSGGRCIVNKKTWYAHWHKDQPSHYGMRKSQKYESERFSTWVWMNDRWPKATRNMQWFVNTMFYPIPGWPGNWKALIQADRDFTVFDPNGHDGFGVNGSGQ